MRTVLSIATILACALLFTACPISTNYPLEKKGAFKTDKALFGTWVGDVPDAEVREFTIAAGAEANTYTVTVTERGDMFAADGDDFIGWIAELGGKRFLVLEQMIDGVPQEDYYVYHFKTVNGNLITNDISLKVGGINAVTSTAAYQEEVLASMKYEDFLASEISWTKK